MTLKKLYNNYFKVGNVSVCGLRGRGKDLLFGNIISRSKKPYISNLDYTHDDLFHQFKIGDFSLGFNTYKNFLKYELNFYEWPYEYETDVYLSDAGIYFPSQYNGELNRDYRYFPNYMALSRQVCHNNIHFNAQNLNRVWDKIREQSDFYIRCNWCLYMFGFVFQIITCYDKYESCINNVKPCRVRVPMFAKKEVKAMYKMHIDSFIEKNGIIKRSILFYRNKSKHDTYYFETMLREGR